MKKSDSTWWPFLFSLVPLRLATWLYTAVIARTPLRYLADALIRSRIPQALELEEGTLLMNQRDVAVSGLLALGRYEPYQTELIRTSLKPGMTVVDVGANIGLYSLIASSRIGPTGHVYAFEPEPANFALLSKSVALNSCQNVTVSNSALSDRAGTLPLYITADNNGTHSLVNNRKSSSTVAVRAHTLDDYLASHGSPAIDFIKMDIEGAEALALSGMKKSIGRSPQVTLITEFFPNAIRRSGQDPVHFLETLRALGFELSVIDEDQKKLVPLTDFETFVKGFPKRNYARNIVGRKA